MNSFFNEFYFEFANWPDNILQQPFADVLENSFLKKFTEKHLRWSLFLISCFKVVLGDTENKINIFYA